MDTDDGCSRCLKYLLFKFVELGVYVISEPSLRFFKVKKITAHRNLDRSMIYETCQNNTIQCVSRLQNMRKSQISDIFSGHYVTSM